MIGVARRRVMGGSGADEIIMTSASNPEVLAVCYAQGWCAHSDYMTKREAEAVTSIGTAFSNNTDITHFDELQYFTSLTEIPLKAFYFSNNLASITFPQSITTIGNQSFQRVYGLTQLVLPNSVISIGFGAFFYTTGLTSVDLSNTSITSLGDQCFQYSNITNISLPSTLSTIGDQTFTYSKLTTVTLPDMVSSIGNRAFGFCSSLVSFTILATTPPTITSIFTSTSNNCPIYVPASAVADYQAASGWSSYASRIQAIP